MAADAAEENRLVVADQVAAAPGEDGRLAPEARPVYLALAGGEPSGTMALRGMLRQIKLSPLPAG